MKKSVLLRTNMIICCIIVLGFAFTSILNYQSKLDSFHCDIENVSAMATNVISSEIGSALTQPIELSSYWAHSIQLQVLLTQEASFKGDAEYTANIYQYLRNLRADTPFDSIFTVTADGSYFHSSGRYRTLSSTDPWLTKLLDSPSDFSVGVSSDPDDENSATVFFNNRVIDSNGIVLGVIGIGIRAERIQGLLKKYRITHGVDATLLGRNGNILLSAEQTSLDGVLPFFAGTPRAEAQEGSLTSYDATYSFWYYGDDQSGYLVSHYYPDLDWFLVVDNDTTARSQHFRLQLLESLPIVIGIVVLTQIIILRLIKRYDARISELTIAPELEYHRLLMAATEGLYDNIFEWNITKNCIGGEGTQRYLQEHFGIGPRTPYDAAIRTIAEKQFKPEFVQGYLKLFHSAHVLELYAAGTRNIEFDLMTAADHGEYQWMRITARIFFWASDHTVRLISYRKIIDEEKRRELTLLERSRRDSLTGLLNKQATAELIELALQEAAATQTKCAFFIFDVDDFKLVNDNLGHASGDHILQEFSTELKAQFRDTDLLGRIGGDEFVVLMREYNTSDVVHAKLSRLFERLKEHKFGGGNTSISTSIGVAFYPDNGTSYMELYENADQALYFSKGHGKNCYHVCGESSVERPSFRMDLRDIEMLINTSMDGISKIACVGRQLRILYFNARRMELTGTSAQVWSAQDYNMLDQIHPDDAERVLRVIQNAIPCKKPFCAAYRLLHANGCFVSVMLRGLFVSELFENEYPVFYAVYTNLSDFEAGENGMPSSTACLEAESVHSTAGSPDC